MFIEQERELIKKDYVASENNNTVVSFFYKSDPLSQIEIKKEKNNYKVSFPISNRTAHYATKCKTKEEVRNYLNYLINNHF